MHNFSVVFNTAVFMLLLMLCTSCKYLCQTVDDLYIYIRLFFCNKKNEEINFCFAFLVFEI